MNERVQLVECPRDAWQGLPGIIPPEAKAEYLRALITAGFTTMDAVSFVSPSAIPQMADSERVLELLAPPPSVEIIGIVVNEKGAARAVATGAVKTLGFPYSISPEFLRRNQHQTQAESLQILERITAHATAAKKNVVAYISMAFGNPYGDPSSADEVVHACRQLIALGIREISFADTVGLAAPEQVAEIVSAARDVCGDAQLGVHLHARRSEAAAKIRAAYHAGCRRFDGALGGLGGCPFAQDDMVGNIPTEILIAELASLGAAIPALAPLDDLLRRSTIIARASDTGVRK